MNTGLSEGLTEAGVVGRYGRLEARGNNPLVRYLLAFTAFEGYARIGLAWMMNGADC